MHRVNGPTAHPSSSFTLDLADKFFCKLQCPCSIMTESGRAAVALLNSGMDCCLMAGPGPQSRSLFRFRRPPLGASWIQMFMRWGRGGHLSAGMTRRRGCHRRKYYYQLCPRKTWIRLHKPCPLLSWESGSPHSYVSVSDTCDPRTSLQVISLGWGWGGVDGAFPRANV